MRIDIDLTKKRLKLFPGEKVGKMPLMDEPIVSGCNDSTPTGDYKSGKWIKDKTNAVHGPVPWSKDPWSNPYGPYFLEILNLKGRYTLYGIHGTRGPAWSPVAKPPIFESWLKPVVGEDEAKYLYCSHGCIRLSNQAIQELLKHTHSQKSIPIHIHK